MKFTQYLDFSMTLISFFILLTVLTATVADYESIKSSSNNNNKSNNIHNLTNHYNHHHHQQQQQQQQQHHNHLFHHHRPHITDHKNRHQLLLSMANKKTPKKKLDFETLSASKINAVTSLLTLKKFSPKQQQQQQHHYKAENDDDGDGDESKLRVNNKPENLTVTLMVNATNNRLKNHLNSHNHSQTRANLRYLNDGIRNDDWNYHNYQILPNSYDSVAPSVTLHGDDNSNDVESLTDLWRHDYGRIPSTTTTMIPMPALVPARRGYNTITSVLTHSSGDAPHTESPFETNVITKYPNNVDSRDMEKRHICVQQRTIIIPEKKTEIYTRPVLRHISTPCLQTTHFKTQMCTRVQIIHEPSFRDVIHHKSAHQLIYDCCNGWARETPSADSCMKALCSTSCYNGGTCTTPDICSCTVGFAGRYCEQDVNECTERKPCDQTCINTVGSYYCRCREGFILQNDQQSCKKIDVDSDDAFEARDMEYEIERQEVVIARIQKIEKMLANEKVHTNDLEKTLYSTYKTIDLLKSRLINLEKQQYEVNRLQANLYNTEKRTLKLEGVLNLLMKCRNGPNDNCP